MPKQLQKSKNAKIVKVTLPQPMEHQLPILWDDSRFKVLCCGRRFGKTKLLMIAGLEGQGSLTRMVEDEDGNSYDHPMKGALEGAKGWWIAPNHPQATLIWDELKFYCKGIWESKNEVERRIIFPGGGEITVKSAVDPDSLRGPGLDFALLDEFAHMNSQAWFKAIRPALSDKKGWAIIASTPNGDNEFKDMFDAVPGRKDWARWQKPSSSNPLMTTDELEDAREDVGPYVFAQEYLAEFVTPGGGMWKDEWFQSFEETEAGFLCNGQYLRRADLMVFQCVDLAASKKKTADFTVCTTFGYHASTRFLLILDCIAGRLGGHEINPMVKRQQDKWAPVWSGYEHAATQLNMIDLARNEHDIRVRAIRPDKDKVSRFMPVTAWGDAGRIWFPKRAAWLADFEAELIGFPTAKHDDRVDTLSMSIPCMDMLGSGISRLTLPGV